MIPRLAGARLLTLVGPAGAGRTCLAAELLERRDEPAVVVALDGLGDPALLGSAVLRALGLREDPARDPA